MEECIHFDILFGGRIFNFVSLHGSPSQSHDVFETFADNLELNWDMVANKNSYLIIILVDFNATSSNWYKHGKTTYEGSKIDTNISVWNTKINSGTN